MGAHILGTPAEPHWWLGGARAPWQRADARHRQGQLNLHVNDATLMAVDRTTGAALKSCVEEHMFLANLEALQARAYFCVDGPSTDRAIANDACEEGIAAPPEL